MILSPTHRRDVLGRMEREAGVERVRGRGGLFWGMGCWVGVGLSTVLEEDGSSLSLSFSLKAEEHKELGGEGKL